MCGSLLNGNFGVVTGVDASFVVSAGCGVVFVVVVVVAVAAVSVVAVVGVVVVVVISAVVGIVVACVVVVDANAAAANSSLRRRSFSFCKAIFRKYWWFVFSGVRQIGKTLKHKLGNAKPRQFGFMSFDSLITP